MEELDAEIGKEGGKAVIAVADLSTSEGMASGVAVALEYLTGEAQGTREQALQAVLETASQAN